MRTRLSTLIAPLALGLAMTLPAVGDAQPASAALAPIVGCGFHFGAISEQGAAGTLFYTVVVEPANAAQRCTTALTFTASAAPLNPASGPYTTIQENPLTATQTVTFAPGRLPPANHMPRTCPPH